eukprot:6032044-Pyramimonas_sp.AAC.1
MMWGHVWDSCPQTPQAGEFAAYAMAGTVLYGPAVLYPNCQNVVSMHGLPNCGQLSPRRPCCGLALQGRLLGGKWVLGREKVKFNARRSRHQ